ncbi:MAG: IS1634 family transposase [Bacteroidetes bacterium]|nr:IS1634 family transposase [Bacteroidota bacterium]
MYKIRQIQYSANSVSIQVYKVENRKRVIVKHIGTSRNAKEKSDLFQIAKQYIQQLSKQISLFEENTTARFLNLNQAEFIGIYYTFLYEVLSKVMKTIGFDALNNKLLVDLAIIRIVEPASKLRSIELLKDYFGISHRRQGYYEFTEHWKKLKEVVENNTISYAKNHYDFKFDLLFYDVTTLYFETFTADELREMGFSKDNKSQQPQILVALMVTKEGFPIAYEIFTGNTFEGHTFIPSVKRLIAKHSIQTFTIVADAAMISGDNIKELVENELHYIVGARMGNLSHSLIDKIDRQITREDDYSIRFETKLGYLICSFSSLRYRKDKYEMEKQIKKAMNIVENPGKSKKLKFTTTKGKKIELNQKLIDKTKKILGIKGYYTNLDEDVADNQTIIQRYHELYKIEQAFRISKHDLQTRPIYHFTPDAIQLHLVTCVMALVVSKHIELQTKVSIKKFLTETKKVTDGRLINKINDEEIRIRAKMSAATSKFLQNLNLLT